MTWEILTITAVVIGAAVAIPFTGGLSAVAVGGIFAASAGTAVAAAGVATAAIVGISGAAAKGGGNGADGGMERELIGSKQLNQWNYKETITSTFEWETLKCNKCTRSQQCTKTKRPLFGNAYCKTWGDPQESCAETQF